MKRKVTIPVTIDCGRCGGTGRVATPEPNVQNVRNEPGQFCPSCHGEGTNRTEVSMTEFRAMLQDGDFS